METQANPVEYSLDYHHNILILYGYSAITLQNFNKILFINYSLAGILLQSYSQHITPSHLFKKTTAVLML